MWRSRPRKLIGFMDLPPELRNIIYELCFVSDRPIRIIKGRKNAGDATRLTPKLLATCQVIRSEATAILYGSNSFHLFPDDESAWRPSGPKHLWANSIGVSKKYIRTVTLEPSTMYREERDTLHSLRGASSLEVLRLSGGFASDAWDVLQMARWLASLVLNIHLSRQDRNVENTADVFDLSQVWPGDSTAESKLKVLLKSALAAVEKKRPFSDGSDGSDGLSLALSRSYGVQPTKNPLGRALFVKLLLPLLLRTAKLLVKPSTLDEHGSKKTVVIPIPKVGQLTLVLCYRGKLLVEVWLKER